MAIKKTEAGTYVCDHMWRRTTTRALNALTRHSWHNREGQFFRFPWGEGQWKSGCRGDEGRGSGLGNKIDALARRFAETHDAGQEPDTSPRPSNGCK